MSFGAFTNSLVRVYNGKDNTRWTQAVKDNSEWDSSTLYVNCMITFEQEIMVGGAIRQRIGNKYFPDAQWNNNFHGLFVHTSTTMAIPYHFILNHSIQVLNILRVSPIWETVYGWFS